MNYWRRYIADYGSKTGANSMVEDGAYTRLLDWYYEHEKALPLDAERIYTITKAMKPPERKAVDHVLATFFDRRADGWHNKRADEELAAALPKLETLRKVAKENGAKGGRPKKQKTESGSTQKPNPVPESVREQEPNRDPDPEPSSQPLNLSETTKSREAQHASAGDIPADPHRVAALTAIFESDGRTELDAKARMHLRQFAAEGVTDQQLSDAIAISRERIPHPAILRAAYVARILPDVRSGTARRSQAGVSPEEFMTEGLRRIAAIEAREAAKGGQHGPN